MSYANVAATMALVFSMSGAAIAAKHYLINSTKQINPKVIRQLRGHNGKNGAKGATGAAGPAGSNGTNGAQGPMGPEGPLVSHVPSGKTISGSYGMLVTVSAGGQFVATNVSYPFPLPGVPTAGVFVNVGATEPIHCPGTEASPKAAAGYLCVYRGYRTNVVENAELPYITDHVGSPRSPHKGDTNGFILEDESSGAGYVLDDGSWAYTAP